MKRKSGSGTVGGFIVENQLYFWIGFGVVVVIGVLILFFGGGKEDSSAEVVVTVGNAAVTSAPVSRTSEATTSAMTSVSITESSPFATSSSEVTSSEPSSSDAAANRGVMTTESLSMTAFATEQPPGTEGGLSEFYKDIRETDTRMGILILCNKQYKLPESYEPNELMDIPENYHVADGKEYKMEKKAAEAFIEMSDAAWYESEKTIDLRVVSGYRSHSYQTWLYNYYKDQYGMAEADTYSARPGHSEHETGLCCDINVVSNEFENTPAFEWLMNNAANYGFILRYPKGKEHITGYMYESWHWRYIGVEDALALVESGLTYDEYYLKNYGE